MLRVGIVGGGGMGGTHARQYRKMSDVHLSVFDRDPGRVESFSSKWEAQAYRSLTELIEHVDVLDVCLPTDLHREACLQAISAGRPVFVEKPVARTLDEAHEVLNAAEKAGIQVGVGHVVRFFPEYAVANRLVTSGAIGKPAAARLRRGGKAPSGANGWFMDHKRSGGVLLDLAIHDFDWIRWTLGEVVKVYARSVAVERGSGPDYALATLTTDNGCVAHVESTWMDPGGFRTTFEVAGSGGLLQHDSRTNGSLVTCTDDRSQVIESPPADLDDPYYLELKAFLDAIKAGEQVPVTLGDGCRALQISLAALESASTGLVVSLIY